jgi:hypothetical protein
MVNLAGLWFNQTCPAFYLTLSKVGTGIWSRMATRAEQSRINGRKGGRKPKTRETQDFPDLESFPWRTHEAEPELTQDQQHGEYLSVKFMRRGRWRSVWIQKSLEVTLPGSGQPVQIADTEPRN